MSTRPDPLDTTPPRSASTASSAAPASAPAHGAVGGAAGSASARQDGAEPFAAHATGLLRIALGVMFLAHAVVLKLGTYGLPGTAAFFADLGLPGWSAYVVFAAETLGGAMLVFGIQARWAALALSPILAGAVWVHWGNGWVFTAAGGGWEYPAYLTLLALCQAMLGDGRYALVRSTVPAVLRRAGR